MEDAIAHKDASQLQYSAHTLKSSSASLGGLEVANICQQLEDRGRTGTTQDCEEHVVKLAHLHQRVAVALTEYCEQYAANRTKQPQEVG